jgi:hypothetical protein
MVTLFKKEHCSTLFWAEPMASSHGGGQCYFDGGDIGFDK